MKWSHNDMWMISGDDAGVIKYWQSNMNNLKILQAHKETVRDLTFSPTDGKFASCSDDGTIKIWSFGEAVEERVLSGFSVFNIQVLCWFLYLGYFVVVLSLGTFIVFLFTGTFKISYV